MVMLIVPCVNVEFTTCISLVDALSDCPPKPSTSVSPPSSTKGVHTVESPATTSPPLVMLKLFAICPMLTLNPNGSSIPARTVFESAMGAHAVPGVNANAMSTIRCS